MKKFLTVGVDPQEVYLASEVDDHVAELDRDLAFANDAAAKGEAARQAAAGMEAQIAELEKALHKSLEVLSGHSTSKQDLIDALQLGKSAMPHLYL